MQVKKQQLELVMEQQTVSRLGKEYIKVAFCHSAYLTYMNAPYIKTHPIKNLSAMKAFPQMLTENNNKLSLYCCSSGFIMCPKCSLVPI